MTISDIAKLAGVSVATVSRVINNKGYVKEETRKKIETLIQESGYRPNAVARSLTCSNTAMIAVIISNRLTPFFAAVLEAIEAKAERSGYSLLLYNTAEDRDKECKAITQAMEHRVMGILLLPVLDPDERTVNLLTMAEESGIPVVLIDRDLRDGEFDIVMTNSKKGVYEGIELLIEAGHENIGIINCPEVAKEGNTRLGGYIQCMEDHGIEVREEYIYSGYFDEMSGYQGCAALLGLPKPPTAVLATCSSETLGCIRYMHEYNMQLGKDAGLVGFDDIALLNALGYKLTVIDRPMWEMGEIAYDLLTERMSQPGAKKRSREVVLQTRLIIRGSEKRQSAESALFEGRTVDHVQKKEGKGNGEEDSIQL